MAKLTHTTQSSALCITTKVLVVRCRMFEFSKKNIVNGNLTRRLVGDADRGLLRNNHGQDRCYLTPSTNGFRLTFPEKVGELRVKCLVLMPQLYGTIPGICTYEQVIS